MTFEPSADFRDPKALRPAPTDQIVAMLTSCLYLVRPVGMSDADAAIWLRTAARELEHLPIDLLADACSAAKRTCDHHAKIVPTIIRETAERLEMRRTYHRNKGRVAIESRPIPNPGWRPDPAELKAIREQAAAQLRADR